MINIKKDLLFKTLGMIVANKLDHTKIAFSVSENDDPIEEPNSDDAVVFDFQFLYDHKVVLDVYFETMLKEKKIQKAIYSYYLLGGKEEKKVSIVIVEDGQQYSCSYIEREL